MQIPATMRFPLSHALVVSLAPSSGGERSDGVRPSTGQASGFIVTPRAHYLFMRENQLDEVAQGILTGINVRSSIELRWAASQIEELIARAPLPQPLYGRLRQAYRDCDAEATALSVWAPDKELLDVLSADRLRARFHSTGMADTLRGVQACWATWYTWQKLHQRLAHGRDLLDFNTAVYVRPVAEARCPALEANGKRAADLPDVGQKDRAVA